MENFNEEDSIYLKLAKELHELAPIDTNLIDDFDLEKEGFAKTSTVARYISSIRKATNTRCKPYICNFDFLKMAIPLSLFEEGEFELNHKNMPECSNPAKLQYIKTISNDEDYEDEYIINERFDIDGEAINIKLKNNPNCQIAKEVYHNNIGIWNIYIENNILYIVLTGKFMAKRGYLGGINKDNILDCLQKVNSLDLFYFDIYRFYENARVYICHEFIDVPVGRKRKEKTIKALSAYLPLCSNRYILSKYRKGSLTLRKKAKNTGFYCTIYDKEAEIKAQQDSNPKKAQYMDTVGKVGLEKAKDILRVETKVYKLEAMRVLFDIPQKEKEVVFLKDLLESQSRCVLILFKYFGFDEEKMYDHLRYYKEIKSSPHITENTFYKLLAQRAVCEVLKNSNHDLSIARNTFIIEYGIENQHLIDNLISTIKELYYNYLVFNKPRSTKYTLDFMNLVAEAYGREA